MPRRSARAKKNGAAPQKKRDATDAIDRRKHTTPSPAKHNSKKRTPQTHGSQASKRFKESDLSEIPSGFIFTDKRNKRSYFNKIREVPIQHDVYVSSGNCSKKQTHQTWTVALGDMVLVKVIKEDQKVTPQKKFRVEKNKAWYPFKCPYAPCQIIAIYQENDGTFGMKIRWFYRSREMNSKEATQVGEKDPKWDSLVNLSEEIVESDIVGAIYPSMLVGRANLISGDLAQKSNERNVGEDGVPIVNYVCRSFLSSDKKMSSIFLETGRCHVDDHYSEGVRTLLSEQTRSRDVKKMLGIFRLTRGLRCLKFDDEKFIKLLKSSLRTMNNHASTTTGEKSEEEEDFVDDGSEIVDDGSEIVDDGSHVGNENLVFDSITEMKDAPQNDDEAVSNSEDSDLNEEDEENMWATELPFHVDVSAQKAFYTSIEVTPPSDHYADAKMGEEVWKLSVGDTVAIHVDTGSMRRRASNRLSDEFLNHPFRVKWWCADIIAIYRNLEADEAKELRKNTDKRLDSSVNDSVKHGNFQVEVRWLYKMDDIPGFAALNTKEDRANRAGLQEIFETDDVDEIGANTILGPVVVHAGNPSPDQELDQHLKGMPLVHFFCHRFWSLHRRTLMPTGTADKRMQRGMLYSKYLSTGTQARSAFQALQGNTDDTPKDFDLNSDWKRRFQSTISKLTLAEASDDSTRSDVIGREAQKAQIKNFLSSAIQGVNAMQISDTAGSSNAFCLFVGGPPGTGKTASVSSTIDQLRKDQAEGTIPEFQFLSLNGMEMRHPFDTYVQLWEAVSPNKEKLTTAKALAKLQLYFSEPSLATNTSNNKGAHQMRRPVVLLVDEIDYLVTQKQTILYNLFDWPMTGYEHKSDAQLIVVGISNTLNLPERLHVRLQSRIGKQRCIFNSYSWNDSVQIIEGKLGESLCGEKSIFHPDAIRFAARKIASESGDIRKVFQLCKSASENVFNQLLSGKKTLPTSGGFGTKVIGVGDVQNAAREMFNSILHFAVSHATSYQALLFVALAALQRNTGRERGGFTIEEVHTKMESMANSLGSQKYLPCPQYHMIIGMLCPLGEAGLLKLLSANGRTGAYGTNGADTLLSLNMDAFEVLSSLKDTAHYPLAQKFLVAHLF